MNSQVEEILKGSFDLHVHAGPDPYHERPLDALEAARYAHEAEMAGFVLKSHQFPTATIAHALRRIYPGLNVAGAIVLNAEVGGLNPDAVQAAADLGARVVWMPTYGADSSFPKLRDHPYLAASYVARLNSRPPITPNPPKEGVGSVS